MYFIGIIILIALLALCVMNLLKDGTLVMPGTAAPTKSDDDADKEDS